MGSAKVEPDDPRYDHLVRRGFNKRFVGQPDYVRLVANTEDVVEAARFDPRNVFRHAVSIAPA